VTQRDRKVNSEAIQDVLRDAGLKAVTRRNFINGVISSSVAIDKREMNWTEGTSARSRDSTILDRRSSRTSSIARERRLDRLIPGKALAFYWTTPAGKSAADNQRDFCRERGSRNLWTGAHSAATPAATAELRSSGADFRPETILDCLKPNWKKCRDALE
jgi:hypothetical protein